MKQGNSSTRVDRGWDKMRPILDNELPHKKRRKGFLWLWLFPLALAISIAAYILLRKENNAPVVSNNYKIQQVNLSQQKEETISLTETQNNKALNKPASMNKTKASSYTSADRQSINNSESTSSNSIKVGTTKTIKKEADHKNTKKTFPIINSNNEKQIVKPSIVLSTKQADIKNMKPAVSDNNSRAQLTIPTKSNLPLVLPLHSISAIPKLLAYDSKLPELPIAINLSPTSIKTQNKESKWKLGLAATGIYATRLESYGTEINTSFSRRLKKYKIGIQLGGGYYFNNVDLQTKFISAATEPETVISNEDNTLGTAGTFSEMELNEVAVTTVHFSKKEHRPYLHFGTFIAYKFLPSLSIKYQLGVEKYFQSSYFSDTGRLASPTSASADNSLEDSIRNAGFLSSKNLIAYNQINLDWTINDKLNLGIGYRHGISELFSSTDKKYHPNKLFMSIGYTF